MLQELDRKRVAMGAGALTLLSTLLALGINLGIRQAAALPEGAELPEAVALAEPGAPGEEPSEDPEAPPAPTSPLGPLSRTGYKDPILSRSIFDSSKVGSAAGPDSAGGVGGNTDLKVRLLATIVANPPSASSALISEGDSKDRARVYMINDMIAGDATILAIEQRRVVIRRKSGEIEYISFDGEAAPAASGGTATPDEGGVAKDGDKFIVDRSLLESAMGNIEQLATQIRVVPHKDANGQVDGYRLSAIRRGSVFDKLGIKNGDVVHAVNGMPLTDPTQAMGAMTSLQSESRFTFDVSRRNQRQTFEYEIR